MTWLNSTVLESRFLLGIDMATISVMKAPNGSLVPADTQSADLVAKMKVGQGLELSFKRNRNVKFHRKFFSLLNYAFDAWEPEERTYKGISVGKNFDQFRRDVTILAGFYDASFRLDGEVRLTAKSISFSNMDEEEFERLYSSVIDVLLQRIFINQTRGDIANVVNNILAYG